MSGTLAETHDVAPNDHTGAGSARVGRAGLAVVTLASGADGVAYVGRLLHRALRDAAGEDPWTVALDPASTDGVTAGERLRFSRRLISSQITGRVDWLVFNHVGIARLQSKLPAALRCPYAVFVHGVEVWPPDLSGDRLATLSGAAVRIANSEYTALRTMALHPGIGPIAACPLGLLPDDPAAVGPTDEALLERVSPRSALIVGRMSSAERYKGHDELLESWPAVLAAVPDAQLLVAGSGDDVGRLRERAQALGISEHVLFCGYVSAATLEGLLQRVALFTMPSRGEGFGLVYLQAMRAGLPCVASTDDAAVDVVVHGETGLLVRQSDGSALTEALVRLLTQEALRRSMGEAGRRRFEADFTYEAFRSRLLPLLAPFAARAGSTGAHG